MDFYAPLQIAYEETEDDDGGLERRSWGRQGRGDDYTHSLVSKHVVENEVNKSCRCVFILHMF